MNENKKCLNCRYCEDGKYCDLKCQEIKFIKIQFCKDYWHRKKSKNFGFSILSEENFDEYGHQI